MPDPIRPAIAPPVDNSATRAPSVGISTDDTTGDARSTPRFAPPADPAEIGQIGPYRVLKQLGHGGMGAVYLGPDGTHSGSAAVSCPDRVDNAGTIADAE